MKTLKIFYICVAILIIGVFLAILYQPIQGTSYEQDPWWMLPLMSSITHGHSVFENIRVFLFDPYPTLQGDPWMNTYLYLVLSIFGFQIKYFIFVLLVLHFLCAFLLYSVLRKLELDFRIAFFSALLYLTAFIHFCSYIWPMAAHHVFVLLLSFLVIYFYFETTKRIDDNRDWKAFFWGTIFANILAAFCQITILLLPLGILAHILIASKNEEDRLKKYDIWMPLFITYLGYPLMRFVYVGYVHLRSFFLNELYLSNSPALFLVFFLLGVSSLFLFRGILKLACRYRPGKIPKNLFIAAIVLYAVILIALYFKHGLVVGPNKVELYKLLSPYNFIYPFCIMFSSFITPIKSALSINSTVAYHMIPFRGNIISHLLAFFFIIIFIAKYFPKYKGLIVFVVFYIGSMRYMRIDTIQIPSRHFIYIMPLLSVVFCSSLIYVYDLVAGKFKKNAREIVLTLIFIGFFIPNILATRLEMTRGRLVNTFSIYDYIRTADIIKHDIKSHGSENGIKANDVSVEGIQPMAFNVDEYWRLTPDDPLRLQAFRYIFATALEDKSMVDVNINRAALVPGKLTYEIKGLRIYGPKGVNVDRFSSYVDEGVKELRSGNDAKASSLFRKAIELRPFLLNYILLEHDLKYLKLITMGKDLKSWIDDIVNYYNGDYYKCEYKGEHFHVAKVKYISSLIKDEIDAYIRCLFYEAYLEQRLGNSEESNSMVNQIQFIENKVSEISSSLNGQSLIQSNPQMSDFLRKLKSK